MSETAEPNDMLISVHKRLVSGSKLMKETVRRNVGNDVGETVGSL